MEAEETAGTKMFDNDLIAHEVFRWLRLEGNKDLVSCLVANRRGFRLASKVLYYVADERIAVTLAQACCPIQRLVQCLSSIKVISLESYNPPSRQKIRSLQQQFENLGWIRFKPEVRRRYGSKEEAFSTIRLSDPFPEDPSAPVGDLFYLHDASSDPVDPLGLPFGLMEANRTFHLKSLRALDVDMENGNNHLASLFSAVMPTDALYGQLRSMLLSVEHLTTPLGPLDERFEQALALLPNLKSLNLGMDTDQSEYYTSEIRDALLRVLKTTARVTNPALTEVVVELERVYPEWTYPVTDMLGHPSLTRVILPWRLETVARSSIADRVFAPSSEHIRRTNGRGQRRLVEIVLDDGQGDEFDHREIDTLEPFYMACWLFKQSTPDVIVDLWGTTKGGQDCEWTRRVKDIRDCLVRTAFNTGSPGFRRLKNE